MWTETFFYQSLYAIGQRISNIKSKMSLFVDSFLVNNSSKSNHKSLRNQNLKIFSQTSNIFLQLSNKQYTYFHVKGKKFMYQACLSGQTNLICTKSRFVYYCFYIWALIDGTAVSGHLNVSRCRKMWLRIPSDEV